MCKSGDTTVDDQRYGNNVIIIITAVRMDFKNLLGNNLTYVRRHRALLRSSSIAGHTRVHDPRRVHHNII